MLFILLCYPLGIRAVCRALPNAKFDLDTKSRYKIPMVPSYPLASGYFIKGLAFNNGRLYCFSSDSSRVVSLQIALKRSIVSKSMVYHSTFSSLKEIEHSISNKVLYGNTYLLFVVLVSIRMMLVHKRKIQTGSQSILFI